jgi:hypothetical protein
MKVRKEECDIQWAVKRWDRSRWKEVEIEIEDE